MVSPHHPDDHNRPAGAQSGGRLNLLLSCPGWRQDAWADSLPRLLEPMGVRAMRAVTGEEASRIISQRPVHIAVVDLGLPLGPADEGEAPEEGGVRLLQMPGRLAHTPATAGTTHLRPRRH